MHPMNDYDQAAYGAVDDALRTYPLESPPVSILPVVLERIQPRQPQTSFRLPWIDYAISLFAAMMASLGVFFWIALPLPPDWNARLGFKLLAWSRSAFSAPPFYGIVLLSGLLLSLLGVIAAARLFSQEHRSGL